MLGWCIVILASARLKASVRFPPFRGMYQKRHLQGVRQDLSLTGNRPCQ